MRLSLSNRIAMALLLSTLPVLSCSKDLDRNTALKLVQAWGQTGNAENVSYSFPLGFTIGNTKVGPDARFENWERFLKIHEAAGLVTSRTETPGTYPVPFGDGRTVPTLTVEYKIVPQDGVGAIANGGFGAVVVGKWQCESVTGIQFGGDNRSEAIVETTWRLDPTPLNGRIQQAFTQAADSAPRGGEALQHLNNALNEVASSPTKTKRVAIVRFDDGWRVQGFI